MDVIKIASERNPASLGSKSRTRPGIPRAVDVAVSLAGMILSAPLLGLAATAVAITTRDSVIFRQERVGLGGRRFLLYKLRTMRLTRQGPLVTAADDSRVTRVGAILRRTKIDEIPSLWNVFKGDMSLVGPRPEVPRYVNLADPLWKVVLLAKPGLTDPVTLRLRNEEALLARVEGDHEDFYLKTLQPFKLKGYVEYLEQRSARRDLGVLLRTGFAVFLPSKTPLPTVHEITASRVSSIKGQTRA